MCRIMKRFGRVFGVLCGLLMLALSAGSVSAMAASPRTTTIIALSPIPDISYGDTQVTVRGTLETYSADVSARQPIAGKTVAVALQTYWKTTPLTTATTGADGVFSVTVTLPTPGNVLTTFAGDSEYSGYGTGYRVDPVTLPTRVTLDPLPASATAYTYVTATGTVEMQTSDGWIPAPGATVRVTDARYAETDAAGRFSVPVPIISTGPWTAHAVEMNSFVSSASSDPQSMAVLPAAVTITGFSATYSGMPTSSVAADQGLAFTATVRAGITTADLYFRPRGTVTWTKWGTYGVTYGKVTASGISGWVSKGHPREGSWQFRTLATPLLQAAASPVISPEVYVETYFSGLKTVKVGKYGYLRGVLTSESGRLGGQRVTMFYRYPGRTYEHRYVTVTTKGDGSFSIKLPGKRRYYRLLFNGKGDYEGIFSPEIYYK